MGSPVSSNLCPRRNKSIESYLNRGKKKAWKMIPKSALLGMAVYKTKQNKTTKQERLIRPMDLMFQESLHNTSWTKSHLLFANPCKTESIIPFLHKCGCNYQRYWQWIVLIKSSLVTQEERLHRGNMSMLPTILKMSFKELSFNHYWKLLIKEKTLISVMFLKTIK